MNSQNEALNEPVKIKGKKKQKIWSKKRAKFTPLNLFMVFMSHLNDLYIKTGSGTSFIILKIT